MWTGVLISNASWIHLDFSMSDVVFDTEFRTENRNLKLSEYYLKNFLKFIRSFYLLYFELEA
jgi:hypothetical protein